MFFPRPALFCSINRTPNHRIGMLYYSRKKVLSRRESSQSRICCRVRSGGGLVVLFVDGDSFEVFSFKNLVTFQAADIIDPVAPRQNLGTTVIAGLHSRD